MNTPPLLLLHGAWHAGATWDAVATPLRQRGFEVLTPDLPGHGTNEVPSQKVSLRHYVDAVHKLLQSLASPAIVVGHSMAGMVLAQSTSNFPELIREAIYLCAYLPRDGESVFDLIALERGEGGALAIEQALRMSDDKRTCGVDPTLASSLFYGDVEANTAAHAVTALRPQSTLPLAGKVKLNEENFAQVPRTYICCTRDQVIPLEQQHRMVQRQPCQELLQVDSDHSPFLSHPDLLVEILTARLTASVQ